MLDNSGNIQVTRANAPGTIFQGYTVGTNTPTVTITAGGSATFAGDVQCDTLDVDGSSTLGDDTLSSANALVARNNKTGETGSTIWAINKHASGYVFVGNDENVNVTSSIANDGSATFSDQIISGTASQRGSFKAFSTGNSGAKCFLVQHPTTSANYFAVNGDGSATFAGSVTSTNTSNGFTSNATSFPFTAESSLGNGGKAFYAKHTGCLLYTSPSPRDATLSRMPSSA